MVSILVLDKKGTNSKLAKELLAPMGHQVIPVVGASLALFLAHKNLPELILSDMELADGSGLDFIKAIKDDPELQTIPFIFVATSANENLKAQALALGATKFLVHPIKADALLSEIRPYLKERTAMRAPETPE